MSYATLADANAQIKTQRGRQGATAFDATEAAKVRQALNDVTHRVDITMHYEWNNFFEPYVEAREFFIEPRFINSGRGSMRLEFPLLEFTSVSIGGTTLSATQAGVKQRPPYDALYLLGTNRFYYTWYSIACVSTCDLLEATITGIWGYNRRYARAWQKADELQAAITAMDATISVADADGNDYWGFTPRFSPGQLIKLTTDETDEYMRITGVSYDTNTLTVLRGENGTSAIAHTTDTPDVDVWYPEDSIRRLTARQAGLLYARRGAFEAKVTDAMGGETIYPQDLLLEMQMVLTEYAYI